MEQSKDVQQAVAEAALVEVTLTPQSQAPNAKPLEDAKPLNGAKPVNKATKRAEPAGGLSIQEARVIARAATLQMIADVLVRHHVQHSAVIAADILNALEGKS